MSKILINDETLSDLDSAHGAWIVAREKARDLQLQLAQAERELLKAELTLARRVHVLMDY